LHARRLRHLAGGALLVSGVCVLSHGTASAQATAGVRAEMALATKAAPITRPVPPITDRIVLIADRDDDDGDGLPDAESESLAPLARADLVTLDARFAGATLSVVSGGESARLVASGKPLPWGSVAPRGAQLQGLVPGRSVVVARTGKRERAFAIEVHGVGLRDGAQKNVDLAREHASLQRTPPARVNLDDAGAAYDDPDALRVTLTSPEGTSLGQVSVESVDADGKTVDVLRDVKLSRIACDRQTTSTCLASAPLRFVVDDVDRRHPLVAMRSLRAEVGGAIVVRDAAARKLQAIRVAGPRTSAVGPIGRHRLSVRAVVMRMSPGGAPSVGGTDAGAIAALRQELALAAATWGQCGISFGATSQLDIKVVSPPPPYLVAIGDDLGLPASGGEIHLRVDGKPLVVTTRKGWSTRQVALEMQRVAAGAKIVATVSENARIAPGAAPSVDVAMRRGREGGPLSTVELVSSSDPTLSVHVGAVDLTDGLQHFGDTDSVAGTLEERALVKAVDDGDPHTIEIIVVPFFAGGGRIGESFIASDGSSMRNVVILDRAGVRARRTSLTLAHELGHVILDEPGHPDDYGVDTPTLLMDSDASDASPFGPRRLTVDECARAVRQSGPDARVPLLTAWKLAPLKYTR
jgi:hypothetical protein